MKKRKKDIKNIELPNDFIFDNECFNELSRHFIYFNRKLEEVKKDNYIKGFLILADNPYFEIKYNNSIFQITIVKTRNKLHWYLKPYEKSYFIYPSKDINSSNVVIQAIKKQENSLYNE